MSAARKAGAEIKPVAMKAGATIKAAAKNYFIKEIIGNRPRIPPKPKRPGSK